MSVQAQWHDMTWDMAPDRVRQMTSLSTSRELDVEKNEDSEGAPPSQAVKVKLQTLEVSYSVSTMQGAPPRHEYGLWFNRLQQAIHAPFYLGGEQFLGCEFLLTKIGMEPTAISPDGTIIAADLNITFEEYAEEPSGLKQDYAHEVSLRPGVSDYYGNGLEDALRMGATQAEKERIRLMDERGY